MSKQKTAVFVDGENDHYTNDIEKCLRAKGCAIEHLTLSDFHTISQKPDVLKEDAILFVPLENKQATQIADSLLDEHKIPAVGYVHETHAHLVELPAGMVLLKHDDAVEHSKIYAAIAQAERLASAVNATANRQSATAQL